MNILKKTVHDARAFLDKIHQHLDRDVKMAKPSKSEKFDRKVFTLIVQPDTGYLFSCVYHERERLIWILFLLYLQHFFYIQPPYIVLIQAHHCNQDMERQ